MAKLNHKGATLLEISICMSLFLIGMQSLLTVTTQCMVYSKRAEYVYTAYNLAKNHMERLKAVNFSSLATAAETSTTINTDGDPDENGRFIRSTTVTSNYTGDANLVQITVSVYYVMKNVQSSKPMQISCVIYNGG